MTESNRLQLPKWVDIIYLALLAFYILAGTSYVPFHGDESTLVYMGRDYYYQFVQQDLSMVMYHNPAISQSEQDLRMLNGTISKYMYGFAAYTGAYKFEELNEQWDWSTTWDINVNRGAIPEPDLLNRARFSSALQTALAMVVLFVIAVQVFNRPTAYIASLYFALNPVLLMNGRRAMMEGSHILTLLLVILAAIWVLRYQKWWTFILLGIVSGLALSSKHTNIMIIGVMFILCFIYPLLKGFRSRSAFPFSPGIHFVKLTATVVLSFVVFYALNPAWWESPFPRAAQVMELRAGLLSMQVNNYGGYEDFGAKLDGFFQSIFVGNPQYYEDTRWEAYIPEQIIAYESTIWSGIPIGGTVIGGFIVLGLVLFAYVSMFRNSYITGESKWLIIFWTLAILTVTLLITPFNWQRYYLPAFPLVGLMLAYGVSIIMQSIKSRFTT